MIKKKLVVSLLIIIFSVPVATAQKYVILEKIQCWASQSSTMKYWKDTNICKLFGSQLNALLSKYNHPPLADTLHITIEDLNEIQDRGKIKNSTFTDSDNLHLFMGISEITPSAYFFHTINTDIDSGVIIAAKTIFQIRLVLMNPDKSIVVNDSLDLIVRFSNTPGMGVLSPVGYVTPKGFLDIIKAGLNLLLNPKNEFEQIEAQVAPAFAGDNYILPKTIKQPRIYVTTSKDISRYTFNNTSQMIRLGEPMYEEIKIKDKKGDKYPEKLTKAIKNTNHYAISDFVYLRQDCRDVLHDRNYQIKLVAQVDPESPLFSPTNPFTDFLAGNFHYLLSEKDTLAVFSIAKSVEDASNEIYPSQVSNGFDSTSLYSLPSIIFPRLKLRYAYVVTGKIGQQVFSIKCSDTRNTVKELFLNNTLICIAQGKFSPEKLVIFDASLSPELLNQLFMIGFNRFFE